MGVISHLMLASTREDIFVSSLVDLIFVEFSFSNCKAWKKIRYRMFDRRVEQLSSYSSQKQAG